MFVAAFALAAAITLPPELSRVLTDYEAAWRKGDGAALASLFDEDGYVLPNGAPPVRGRAAIQQYYKGPGGALVLHAYAYSTEGPVGYIIGGFSRQEGSPDVGKFTLTLRKNTTGQWLIVSDMDNGNRRPDSPPATTAGPGGYEMAHYFLAFLYRGPNWTPQETEETKRIQEGHMANIRKMAESGKLIVAGPFLDDGDLRGIFLFQNVSREEAEQLCAADPAVQAGRLRIELHPWFAAKGIKVDPPKPPSP